MSEDETMNLPIVLGIVFGFGALAFALTYDPVKAAAIRAREAWREREQWKKYQDYLYNQRGRR